MRNNSWLLNLDVYTLILGSKKEPAMAGLDLRFPGRRTGRFTSSKVNKDQVCHLCVYEGCKCPIVHLVI